MSTTNKIPSFGSTINISKLNYLKAVQKKLPEVGYPWTIYESKYLKEGYSDSASYCTMGVIKNSEGNGFLFHLRPRVSPPKDIYTNLNRAARILRKNVKELTGILIGGGCDYKPSKTQYEMLESMFKELQIKYSAFLGQKPTLNVAGKIPYSNIYFNAPKDNYILCPLANPFQTKTHFTIKDLNELYDKIILRKGDALIFD